MNSYSYRDDSLEPDELLVFNAVEEVVNYYNQAHEASQQQCEKCIIVALSNAVVEPVAMMVESFYTLIACSAMFGCFMDLLFADFTCINFFLDRF